MEVKYYIVEGSVLPEVFKKVVEVKRLLELDVKIPINAACQKAGISRSTYYKYKDSVYEFYENRRSRIVTFSLSIENKQGLLSNIIEIIAGSKANILTINQNIPMNGVAIVVMSIETARMENSVDVLINQLRESEGVKKVDVLSRS